MTSKQRTYSTLTEALRDAINRRGLPFKTLERETGVKRQSLMKFAAGESSLRLDIADRLVEYFEFTVVEVKSERNGI